MKKLLSIALLLIACDYQEERLHALEGHGFSNVKLGDLAWFGCGKDESGRHFTATSPNGKTRVEGIVCCAPIKACTVRF